MENQPPVYHAIVVAPGRERILVVPEGDRWGLPSVVASEQHLWQDPSSVNRCFGETLGFESSVLRRVASWKDGDHWHDVYALNTRVLNQEPPAGSRWIGCNDAAMIEFADEHIQSIVINWFHWRAQPAPADAVPWYRSSWLDAVLDWSTSELEEQGIWFDGHCEQIRWWNISAVLRLRTGHGSVYFKAMPAMFSHEGAVIAVLGGRQPDLIPRLIARDDKRGWLLLADAGSQTLQDVADVDRWGTALLSYARLQIDSIAYTERLNTAGCPTVSPDDIAAGIDRLLEEETILVAPDNGLSADELAQFRSLASELKWVCAKLDDLDMPLALEHGDFHARQVIANEEGDVFIDWTDARIAHPFFSLTSFLREETFAAEAGEHKIDFEENRTRLRNAYLQPWLRIVPAARIREAYSLAEQLDLLDGALTYARMLTRMEIPGELAGVPPFFIRLLLERHDSS